MSRWLLLSLLRKRNIHLFRVDLVSNTPPASTHKCQIHKDISIRRWPNNKTRSHKTIPIVVVVGVLVQRTAHGNSDERHMLVAATQSVQLKYIPMAFCALHL